MVTATSTSVTLLRLTQGYQNSLRSLDTNSVRIAGGTRIPQPSDNPTDFFRVQSFRSENRSLELLQREARDGIALLDYVDKAAEEIFHGLHRLKELTSQYYNASTTGGEQTIIKAEFDTLVSRITELQNDVQYEGRQVFADSSADPLRSITLDPHNGSNTMEISFGASEIVDVSALDITDTGAATVQAAIDNELVAAGGYLGKVTAYKKGLQAHHNLAYKRIEQNESMESTLSRTDPLKEIANFTKQQVLQQTGVAMIAQAQMQSKNLLMLVM